MRRTITTKLSPPTGFLDFMKACSEIFNHHVEWSFNVKSYNKIKAHKELYEEVKLLHPSIPTAILQSIRDTAMEAIKATKFKTKPHKRHHSAIRYDRRTMSLRGNLLTYSWSGKRIKQQINIPKHFQQYINWKFKGGTICYDKFKKQFYVKLVFETGTPPSKQSDKIVGVDRGLYNIISLSDGKLYSSVNERRIKRKTLFNKRKLQEKGTKSAIRKLCLRSGSEKRFILNQNHVISKLLVNLDYDIFVLENLKGIRKQRSKGKKINKWLHNWSFYQLEQLIKYKAEALGKQVVYVDARYTSQKCSCCGYTDKRNRDKSKYGCIKCGHAEHADINAAKNIKNNYLTSLFCDEQSSSKEEQAAVNQPNVFGPLGRETSSGACPLSC